MRNYTKIKHDVMHAPNENTLMKNLEKKVRRKLNEKLNR